MDTAARQYIALAGIIVVLNIALQQLQAQMPTIGKEHTRPQALQYQGVALVADLHNRYRILANEPYWRQGNYECTLDAYIPRYAVQPVPTVIMIHGGGWVSGTKEIAQMHIIPYLAMGFAVVNVGYRLGHIAPAPAAVEDIRAALRWIGRNSKTYMLDTAALIVTGHSAGGHLALLAGMLPPNSEFDRASVMDARPPRIAAIINWFGITDVTDQIDGGEHVREYAVRWFGREQNRELARRISPLTYVRKGLPPILTIHGNADSVVPYSHAMRLHEALAAAGASHRLYTIPRGGHGGFSIEETVKAYMVIQEFLQQHHLLSKP
ncbi:MAG: alpha/beta hydrolase [Bacteroidota bacterium]|nr:alpha/beta hydrolase [Bacteroidota bacterium]